MCKEGQRTENGLVSSFKNHNLDDVAKASEKLVEVFQRLNNLYEKAQIHLRIYNVAITEKETLRKADRHIFAALEAYEIMCPFGSYTRELKMYANKPEEHPRYMLLEKMEQQFGL